LDRPAAVAARPRVPRLPQRGAAGGAGPRVGPSDARRIAWLGPAASGGVLGRSRAGLVSPRLAVSSVARVRVRTSLPASLPDAAIPAPVGLVSSCLAVSSVARVRVHTSLPASLPDAAIPAPVGLASSWPDGVRPTPWLAPPPRARGGRSRTRRPRRS